MNSGVIAQSLRSQVVKSLEDNREANEPACIYDFHDWPYHTYDAYLEDRRGTGYADQLAVGAACNIFGIKIKVYSLARDEPTLLHFAPLVPNTNQPEYSITLAHEHYEILIEWTADHGINRSVLDNIGLIEGFEKEDSPSQASDEEDENYLKLISARISLKKPLESTLILNDVAKGLLKVLGNGHFRFAAAAVGLIQSV